MRRKVEQVRSSLGTAVYPHMPILRTRHAVESPTGTFIVFYALADSSDFALLGSKAPQNGRFPTWDDDEPTCKILRR